MSQSVQEYLASKRHEKEQETIKEKNELLISLGLFEKEYGAEGASPNDYPFCEWDSKGYESKYFRKVPLSVSDEEYAEIMKYQKGCDR